MTALPSCSPARCAGASTDTPGAPPHHCPTPVEDFPNQAAGLRDRAGICGQTDKGCFPSWLEHCKVSPGMVCRAVELERILSGMWERLCCCCTWGAALHPCQAPQNSSFLKTQGAVPRPRGAGTGRHSGGRAGCWRAGTHPSTWEAHWDGEGREERPRREAKQGVAPGALVMHYWKHLAWDVGACTGCTHMCTSTWVWGNIHTHMCLWVHVYQYMNPHLCTCMLTCATYPYMCMCVLMCAQTHIHRHEHLHTHVDTPRHVYAYRCKHIQLHVYTPVTT